MIATACRRWIEDTARPSLGERLTRQAARRLAMLRRASISRNATTPPSDESLPPSKRAMMGLPQTGDRPGSAGVDSTLAGMASEIDRVEVSQPNLIADQGVAPCPLNLKTNPG